MAEAAALVGVTTETRRAWVKRGMAEGLDALAERKPESGGRHKLTAAQREEVLAWGDVEPRTTMPTLRARIAAAWGGALSEPPVWKLVRRGAGTTRRTRRRRRAPKKTRAAKLAGIG